MSFANFDEIYLICCEFSKPAEDFLPAFDHPVITDVGRLGERRMRISRKMKRRSSERLLINV